MQPVAHSDWLRGAHELGVEGSGDTAEQTARDAAGSVGWTKTDGSECDITVAGDANEVGVDADHACIDQARVGL